MITSLREREVESQRLGWKRGSAHFYVGELDFIREAGESEELNLGELICYVKQLRELVKWVIISFIILRSFNHSFH